MTVKKREPAFVVEGPSDRAVVSVFAQGLGIPHPVCVPLMGSPRVMSAESSVLALLDKGFPWVIVVFDADCPQPAARQVEAQIISRVYDAVARYYGQKLARSQALTIPVSFITLVRDLEEDWLGGKKPQRGSGPEAWERLAKQINMKQLEINSQSFQSFASAVRHVLGDQPAQKATRPRRSPPRLRKTG